ncbi:MAG: hypothetical protein ACT6Q7_03010 [Blastomonas fulva]|uniref:hypothetical protein n=1 Tax=Blastomonas fulva TaxID=1550728 RepID=UPI0040336858
MTLIETLDQFAAQFQRKTRDNGTEFICPQDGAPEWISDAMFAAHDNGEIMPNDWTYRIAADIVCQLCSDVRYGLDIADAVDRAVDAAIPCYNADRTDWLASHLSRGFYVDDAVAEYGWPQDGGIYQAIAYGIQLEARMIADAIAAACLAHCEPA